MVSSSPIQCPHQHAFHWSHEEEVRQSASSNQLLNLQVRKVAQRGGSSSDAQHNGERIIELLARSSMGTVSADLLEKEWQVFRSEGMLGSGQGQAWVSDADMVIEDIMFRHVLDTEKLLEEKEKAELESLRWKEEAMLAAKNAAENERLRRSVALLNQELEATRESRDTTQEALKVRRFSSGILADFM